MWMRERWSRGKKGGKRDLKDKIQEVEEEREAR